MFPDESLFSPPVLRLYGSELPELFWYIFAYLLDQAVFPQKHAIIALKCQFIIKFIQLYLFLFKQWLLPSFVT